MSTWRKGLLISLCALGLLSPIPVHAWQWETGAWARLRHFESVQNIYPPTDFDLDGDGFPELIRLEDRRASIWQGNDLRWESPPGWQVEQVLGADLTHDQVLELVLLVWRPFSPWPIDRYIPNPGRIQDFQNAEGLSCHLILIGWERGMYRERWAGSSLARPLRAIAAVDLNADGWLELAGIETGYHSAPSAGAESISAWQWNGFGFTLMDRQEAVIRRSAVVYTKSGHGIVLTSP